MNIAVITGASSGLGTEFLAAVAERCPELDEIWILARRRDRLERLAASCPGRTIRPVPLDLTDAASCEAFAALLRQTCPVIRVLVNNAGYEKTGPFAQMDGGDIRRMLDVNAVGMTLVQRLCLPYMRRGSYTVITCSVSSFCPVPGQAVYSATKRYGYVLGRALRAELRPAGINVLLLCPGNMDTEMNPRGQSRQSKQVDRLPFLDMKRLTLRALALAARGSAVYTPGTFYKLYGAATKLLPDALAVPIVGRFFGGVPKEAPIH